MRISLDRTITGDFASSLRREWLETNGLGGWASSTISGAHSRRYHGLLIAAAKPPVGRMVLLSFVLSAAIGAAAGVIITPVSMMEYDRGALLGLKGFGAAVLGGLGQFFGALVAGVILGLAESFCAGYLSSGYKDAVALVLLLLVLFLKPEGLFGSGEAARLKRY